MSNAVSANKLVNSCNGHPGDACHYQHNQHPHYNQHNNHQIQKATHLLLKREVSNHNNNNNQSHNHNLIHNQSQNHSHSYIHNQSQTQSLNHNQQQDLKQVSAETAREVDAFFDRVRLVQVEAPKAGDYPILNNLNSFIAPEPISLLSLDQNCQCSIGPHKSNEQYPQKIASCLVAQQPDYKWVTSQVDLPIDSSDPFASKNPSKGIKRPNEEQQTTAVASVILVAPNQVANCKASAGTGTNSVIEPSDGPSQGDEDEEDELEDDVNFDYEPILTRILNEKKLALSNSPHVIKFLKTFRPETHKNDL